MDLLSGRVPRKLIPFRSDIQPFPMIDPQPESETTQGDLGHVPPAVAPSSIDQAAQSSGSVAEDVAAIAQAKQLTEVSKTICNPAGTAGSPIPT